MGFAASRGRGGIYDYFFCLGRHTGRTDCELPYLPVEEVEVAVLRHWATVRFTPAQIEEFSRETRRDLADAQASRIATGREQRKRLTELERQQSKLVDAYMADAIPVDVLKKRQRRIAAEMADAKNPIARAQATAEDLRARLNKVLELLWHVENLYDKCDAGSREVLNAAVFEAFYVDCRIKDIHPEVAVIDAPLTGPVAAVVEGGADVVYLRRNDETLDARKHVQGSNVTNLAVAVGFEPTVGLHPHTLSRRAP